MNIKSKLIQVYRYDKKTMDVEFENQLFVDGDTVAEDAPFTKHWIVSNQKGNKYTLTLKGDSDINPLDNRNFVIYKIIEASKTVKREASGPRKALNLEVTLDRVLVEPINDEYEKLISLDKKSKQEIESVKLSKCIIVKVGPGKDGKKVPFEPGDVVYTFPNTFEADITVDNVLYLVFKELNIVIKETKPVEETKVQETLN